LTYPAKVERTGDEVRVIRKAIIRLWRVTSHEQCGRRFDSHRYDEPSCDQSEQLPDAVASAADPLVGGRRHSVNSGV
jgi:hypothetical protein